jgi:hypothetical protein
LFEQAWVGGECTLGSELLLVGGVTAWLRSVCVPRPPCWGTHDAQTDDSWLAKRVDDTVARAIAILQQRPDVTAKPEASGTKQ